MLIAGAGKGTMTLNPIHSDRYLVRPTALAGILAVMHACFDMKNSAHCSSTIPFVSILADAPPARLRAAASSAAADGLPQSFWASRTIYCTFWRPRSTHAC
jgi:hypothetical protein